MRSSENQLIPLWNKYAVFRFHSSTRITTKKHPKCIPKGTIIPHVEQRTKKTALRCKCCRVKQDKDLQNLENVNVCMYILAIFPISNQYCPRNTHSICTLIIKENKLNSQQILSIKSDSICLMRNLYIFRL